MEACSRRTAGGRQRPLRDASDAAGRAAEPGERARHLVSSVYAADLQHAAVRADARGLESAAWRGVRGDKSKDSVALSGRRVVET